jgi:hypothetical protein
MPSTGKKQKLKDRLRRLSHHTDGFVLECLSEFGRLTNDCVSGGVNVYQSEISTPASQQSMIDSPSSMFISEMCKCQRAQNSQVYPS